MKKNDISISKILHEIRNMKTLDNNMINYIDYLSNDDKMIIIMEYNIVIDNLKRIIEDSF